MKILFYLLLFFTVAAAYPSHPSENQAMDFKIPTGSAGKLQVLNL